MKVELAIRLNKRGGRRHPNQNLNALFDEVEEGKLSIVPGEGPTHRLKSIKSKGPRACNIRLCRSTETEAHYWDKETGRKVEFTPDPLGFTPESHCPAHPCQHTRCKR
jgi:hypothetical protein